MTDTLESTLEKALFDRHSVRSFKEKPIGEKATRAVRSEISYACSRDAAIHFQLKLEDAKPFSGFAASYGMFRNAQNYVACVVDTSYEDCLQRAGFWAEMVTLRAVEAGLGTCFVGGTYREASVDAQLRVTWRIPFIVLLGIPDNEPPRLMARLTKSLAGSSKRPGPEQMLAPGSLPFEEIENRWPRLAMALKAVVAAPSSMNRRPARISVTLADDGTSPKVKAQLVKDYKGAEIDLGIAMANWEVCAGGEWEYGAEPIWLP